MAEPLVRVEGLVKKYGDVVAVDGISLTVAPGEMFGLIGPDGAGKTSTLRTVLGLLAPDGGSLHTCGFVPQRQRRELSERIGYLPQRFSLYGDLSIDENIAFFARIHGVRGWRARRDELLDLLRLTPFRERLADRLSGGMKQKLALACTLIHTPALLVLDEPTTGVDPVSRRDFWRILSRLLRSGLTILLTTPYLDEAERCGRVALLHGGRLLALDRPAHLQAALAGELLEVAVDLPRPPIDLLASLPGVLDVQSFGDRAHVRLAVGAAAAGARTIEAALTAKGLRVIGVRPIAASLEDVFIDLIGAADGAPAGQKLPKGSST